jgi:hypothetical protein
MTRLPCAQQCHHKKNQNLIQEEEQLIASFVTD